MTALERLYNAAVVPVVVLDDAADAVAVALCHARSSTSLLQPADGARPGTGRYEVRKK